MPTFEVLETELHQPTDATLTGIHAVMLWPDDAVAREEYRVAAAADRAFEIAPAGPITLEMKDLHWIRDALPMTLINERTGPRHRQGFVIGYAVCELLQRVADPARTFGEAKQRAAAAFRDVAGAGRGLWSEMPLVKMIDNEIWPALKPAAHLWAAYVASIRRGHDEELPCEKHRLAHFLAIADLILRTGAAYKLPRKSFTLFDADTAWQPPDAVRRHLPQLAFN